MFSLGFSYLFVVIIVVVVTNILFDSAGQALTPTHCKARFCTSQIWQLFLPQISADDQNVLDCHPLMPDKYGTCTLDAILTFLDLSLGFRAPGSFCAFSLQSLYGSKFPLWEEECCQLFLTFNISYEYNYFIECFVSRYTCTVFVLRLPCTLQAPFLYILCLFIYIGSIGLCNSLTKVLIYIS